MTTKCKDDSGSTVYGGDKWVCCVAGNLHHGGLCILDSSCGEDHGVDDVANDNGVHGKNGPYAQRRDETRIMQRLKLQQVVCSEEGGQ